MFFEVCGWIGMVLVLVAYVLLSINKINNGKIYQLINLIAALLMAIGLFPKKAWFSFALQIIWGMIALISIFKNIIEGNKE